MGQLSGQLSLGYAIKRLMLSLLTITILSGGSCAGRRRRPTSTNPGSVDPATGVSFKDSPGGPLPRFKGQVVPPGQVFVAGGMTVLGSGGVDEGHFTPKAVTVNSFFVDETPVTNLSYTRYLAALSEEEKEKAMPNQEVWVGALAYNDPFVENYLWHPGFGFYPVLGVSWEQAKAYCAWRTTAVNERLAKKAGVEYNTEGDGVPIASGKFVSEYRLLTEAEYEYMARGMIGAQTRDLVQVKQRVYPWDGLSLRGKEGKFKNKYLGNFKRSPGNYKGVPGESDGSAPTSYVYEYPPNDVGVYLYTGVCEWVEDTYRPLLTDLNDLNPFRRDGTLDEATNYDDRYSLIDDDVKVYKGCSWQDCYDWLRIGTRRHAHKAKSFATVGFRCASNSMGNK